MRGTLQAAALVAAGTMAVAAAAAPLRIGPVTNGSPKARAFHVVALGDSGASGRGDPTRQAWSGRYARLLTQRVHHKVLLSGGLKAGRRNLDVVFSGRQGSQHIQAGSGGLPCGLHSRRQIDGSYDGLGNYRPRRIRDRSLNRTAASDLPKGCTCNH